MIIDVALTSDDEVIADARAIQQLMGAHGPLWIAEHIRDLDLEGDRTGVRRFKSVAAEFSKLVSRQNDAHDS